MGLTKEQLLVRDTSGKNMLVSAAAGSGKTFVLVERIINKILNQDNPYDVDEILVVTFTTAAAGEMKDRIRRAIDKAIIENPSDARIRTQGTLIHNAHIRTIDSFCSWIVKNYFYEIDMDPSFRIGSSGELKMLKDEVFSDLLSLYLDADDEDFKLLADAYITGRKTDSLKDMVLSIYDKASSFAWVEDWFDNSLRIYDIKNLEELEQSAFIGKIVELTNLYLEGHIRELAHLLSLYDTDSDSKDRTIFMTEFAGLKGIYDAVNFTDKYNAISNVDLSTRFSSKGTCLNEDDLNKAKDLRNRYKDTIKSLKEDFYSQSLDYILNDLLFVKRQATALIKFTKDYSIALSEAKKKRNIYDFNDVEHMALEILRDKADIEHKRRPVAIELSNHFKEIMVDEYQDSNELQEQILTAITNGRDYFTVGDVKQSIYAFRQASPQLFIDKLYGYPTDDSGDSIRIDLDKNFRSRFEVLDFCNNVFRPMMQTDVGKVAYDAKAELKVGDNDFLGDSIDYQSEIIIATQNTESMKQMDIDNGDELEALVIARRIHELLKSHFMVNAKQDNKHILREMHLRDIVILMRATKGHAQEYVNTLKDCGIPAYVAEETGFFDREEIETVLSMLKVIDNPYNDIPLAAVLHSPMFGFTTERLAEIRVNNAEDSLFACINSYYQDKHSKDLEYFLDTLKHFRQEAIDTPIHEIIEEVLDRTDYGTYCKSLSNGKMAAANLDKLVDEAVSFESTSFKGLARFVSYIEGLKTYDEDLGLAKTVEENSDAVRIMTIHKSKGLEFPVVFVSGCGRGFTNSTSSFAYDDELGLALNYKNPINRLSKKTALFNAVKGKNAADDRGEYFRILYVALTRAVDKLIITGAMKPSKDKSVVEKLEEFSGASGALDYMAKMKSSSSLELIIRALNASGASYNRKIVDCNDLFIDEVEKTILKEQVRRTIDDYLKQDNKDNNPVINSLEFEYQQISASKYKNKYSVSEIKHTAMEQAFKFLQDAAPAFISPEYESYIPVFMQESIDGVEAEDKGKIPQGALYGTAMHRFLECYDFAREDYITSFDEQNDYMKSVGSLSEDEFTRINHKKLRAFLDDDLAKRMHNAAANNKLYKEKPFVFGSNALELFADEDATEDTILVQGIIDVFFEEEDGLVLLDYKTDKVDCDRDLVLRYEKQLQLYKNAIEHAFNQPVKEVLIYSFALERSINLCTTEKQ